MSAMMRTAFAPPRPGHRPGTRRAAPRLLALVLLCLGICLPAPARANTGAWDELLTRLAADGYARDEVGPLFARPDMVYLPEAMAGKMQTLFTRKFAPKPKKSAPRAASAAPSVYPSAMEPGRIADARAFRNRYASLLARVTRTYGVPTEIAVAILSVETQVGRFLGTDPAFVTLASMAHANCLKRLPQLTEGKTLTRTQRTWLDRRIREKADWAYDELKALIDHARASGCNPLDMPGSVYGAIGMCQFMPSNALRFGVDGDGDGRIDLYAPPDALHSLANFLKANGWKKGLSTRLQRKVLYRYNHSRIYTNTILAVADRLRP